MAWYNETHSITFGDTNSTFSEDGKLNGKNTWAEWHLIPSSRPDVALPDFEKRFVSIPGRHGSIDMSTVLVGHPVYADRTGSWEFIVDNDRESWTAIRDSLIDFLHGKKRICVLEDDSQYYYTGRFTVNWKSGEKYSVVSIGYTLEPYKKYWNPNGDWLWDPFNFDRDNTDTVADDRL